MKRAGSLTPIKLKGVILPVLICMSQFVYSQPKYHEITILEKLYGGQPDTAHKIVQEKDNTRRELVLCKSKDEKGFKKYRLTEFGYEDMVTGSAYIVSKYYIPKWESLYDIKLGKQRVINHDIKPQPGDNKFRSKITVKLREEHIDITEPFEKIINKTDEEETTEICLDHWWVTCLAETGEVIDIEFLGSHCYTLATGDSNGNRNGSNADPEKRSGFFLLTLYQKAYSYVPFTLFNYVLKKQ